MEMKPVVRLETVGERGAGSRLRVAHLSDFHLWFSDRVLRAAEECLDAWQPDVLALTGDYADTPRGRRMMTQWIPKMVARYPLCWVAGNHDQWAGRRFLGALEAIPRAHAIDHWDAWMRSPAGGRFRFTSWARMSHRVQAAGDGTPTVVLLHNPGVIDPQKLHDARDHVLLAGHLHGGQITLWRDRGGRPQPASACYRWLGDRFTVGEATLIVSRGLGDTLPLRMGAPHEIVMVDFWARAEVVTQT